MYKCGNCSKRFQNKRRDDKFKEQLLNQYIWQRQTYNDLAQKYGKSGKWIKNKLDEIKIKQTVKLSERAITVVADVTFFSKKNGLIVFREPHLKKNIWWKQTAHENIEMYRFGKDHIEKNGFKITAVVLDGKPGIRAVFSGIPVQMCHFHQKQIVKRYLTDRPKLEAGIALKKIMTTLTTTNEILFTKEINEWYEKWSEFLKQKTTNPSTGRWCYTHKRLRSAYRSLITNLPYLFTFQKYPELNIPNTTNSLDGYFNRLKSLLNVHRGMNSKRRMRVAIEILKGRK